MKVIIDGDVNITEKFKNDIIAEEIHYWQSQDKEVGEVRISKDKDNDAKVVIASLPKQKIKRVRRITGYLSAVENFNDAKRAELNDRAGHGGKNG
jgi:anaerobic ribonucleoside-triphosphate reductase activating protein